MGPGGHRILVTSRSMATDPGIGRFVCSGWPPQHVTGSTLAKKQQLEFFELVMSRDRHALSQAHHEVNVMKAPESRSKFKGGGFWCHFELRV